MGGPAPKSPRLLVVRYLGSSNHEIAYRSTVLLLNAHYARTPPARALGFTRDDVKKVDALLIGHGHGDHMSDAPYVAMKTGAPLVGAPITTSARHSTRKAHDRNPAGPPPVAIVTGQTGPNACCGFRSDSGFDLRIRPITGLRTIPSVFLQIFLSEVLT